MGSGTGRDGRPSCAPLPTTRIFARPSAPALRRICVRPPGARGSRYANPLFVRGSQQGRSPQTAGGGDGAQEEGGRAVAGEQTEGVVIARGWVAEVRQLGQRPRSHAPGELVVGVDRVVAQREARLVGPDGLTAVARRRREAAHAGRAGSACAADDRRRDTCALLAGVVGAGVPVAGRAVGSSVQAAEQQSRRRHCRRRTPRRRCGCRHRRLVSRRPYRRSARRTRVPGCRR